MSKKFSFFALFTLLVSFSMEVLAKGSASASAAQAGKVDPAVRAIVQSGYDRLPLHFESNGGQLSEGIDFYARGVGYGFQVKSDGALIDLYRSKPAGDPDAGQHLSIGMRFEGGNARAVAEPLEQLRGRVNYFFGQDRSKWVTDVSTYGKIRFRSVYPGIDVVYHGNNSDLEYDFVVAPGADPSSIRLSFDGVECLGIDSNGDLLLEKEGETLRQKNLLVYQEVEGERRTIPGKYRLHPNHEVSFEIGSYDRDAVLTIDPTIVYSTYLGGELESRNITLDAAGNVYIVGGPVLTQGEAFRGSHQLTAGKYVGGGTGGVRQSFVGGFLMKIDPSGQQLIFATYLGGSRVNAVALDAAGSIYVGGSAVDDDFPVTSGAFQSKLSNPTGRTVTPDQGERVRDGFVAKLAPAGNSLVFSTLIGGSQSDEVTGLGVDVQGAVHAIGSTKSPDFPATIEVPLLPVSPSAFSRLEGSFVTKFRPDGTSLVYSRLFFGYGSLPLYGIVVAFGKAYIAAATSAPDYPTTTDALRRFCCGAVVMKLDESGGFLLSTFLPGGIGDSQAGIALDSVGNIYVAGGSTNGVVTKLNPSGSSIIYSTILPGPSIFKLALDSTGRVFVLRGQEIAALSASGASLEFTISLPAADAQPVGLAVVGAGEEFYVTGVKGGLLNLPVVRPLFARNSASFLTKFQTQGTLPRVLLSDITPKGGRSSGGYRFILVEATSTFVPSQTSVLFGGVEAPKGNQTNIGAAIIGTVPAHSPGVVPLEAVNPDGSRTGLFYPFYYTGTVFNVTSASPSTLLPGGGVEITIRGSGFVPGDAVVFTLPTTPPRLITALRTDVVSESTIVAITPPLPPGTYPIDVHHQRNAFLPGPESMTSTVSVTVSDRPDITRVQPKVGVSTGGTPVGLAGAGFKSTPTVLFGGVPATRVTFDPDFPDFISVLAPSHAPGIVDLVVTNPDGNSTTVAGGFRYLGPVTVSTINPANGSSSGGASFTISGSGFVRGARVTFGSILVRDAAVLSDTMITGTTPPHAPGEVTVFITNPDGEMAIRNANGFAVVGAGFTFDGPIITVLNPRSGPIAGGNSISITGTGFATGANVFIDGVQATPSPGGIQSATTLSVIAPPHAAGPVEIVVVNPNGDAGRKVGAYIYLDAAPTVASVSPATGSTTGGSEVIITGTNFTNLTSVSIAGRVASTTFVSGTSLKAIVPGATSPGAVDVTVTNPDGQTARLANGFTYQAPPAITSVTPIFGADAGGTVVTIAGSNFVNGATVSFGGTAATNVTFVSAQQLTATTAAHAAGLVDVRVVNSPGFESTRTGAFTYRLPAPTLSAIAPARGSNGGGTVITLTGTGFVTGATVSIGGTAATSVQFVSPTTLTAVAPAHALGVVDVMVTNPDTQTATLAGAFTFVLSPAVTRVDPPFGPLAGGTPVTLTGSNFAAGAQVSFGAAAATAIQFVNATTIRATTPAGPGGKVDVVVTNTDGLSERLAGGFTYADLTRLTLSTVAPAIGVTTGGETITVSGTGFATGLTLFFGNLTAVVSAVTPTSITATAPPGAAGTVDVTVVNTDGSGGVLRNGYAYRLPAPTLVGITPVSGPEAGGTAITLSGANFVAGATVTIGGTPATGIVVVSATSITATTPAHARGVFDVVVTNPDGQAVTRAGAFTFVAAAPTFASITPASGGSAGGDRVTIRGTGFFAGAVVNFGTVAATSVTVVDATTITAVTPPHDPGAVDIAIVNVDGQRGSAARVFTYISLPPVVSSITPNTGPATGRTPVVIKGRGFISISEVTFGGTTAIGVTVLDPETILVLTPGHVAGVVDVKVTNPDGQSMIFRGGYTYTGSGGTPGPTGRGDANGDGAVSVSDVFYMINFLFSGGPAPTGNGDATGDGTVSVADIFFLITHLFAGGPAPA